VYGLLCVETAMSFARYFETCSQFLPQCCKYIEKEIIVYMLNTQGVDTSKEQQYYILNSAIEVNSDGFIRIRSRVVLFDMFNLRSSTPPELDHYVDATRKTSLTSHDIALLKLLIRDRWYKGDFERLQKMLEKRNVNELIKFACNVMWERGYENHYTLGQQLSIRITTKLIQSGLDFKHQQQDDVADRNGRRGWEYKPFEKFINSISSISDVIKRHKCSSKYILIETTTDADGAAEIKNSLAQHFTVYNNTFVDNLCLILMDEDKNSMQYLKKLSFLIQERVVNVIFVTDLDHYMKLNHYPFYLYNSLKLYYYCLRNKFVFDKNDYEMIFLLNLIVSLEWYNGGHLNSFTLEKSKLYNPLELSTRRFNSIKRAANQSRIIANDNEIKMDFIRGKRMKTGTNYGHRLVDIE
jgi:hypothetical protein